jgi:hypothetical protein
MAIIVEYLKDNKKYIYIGASYSYYKEKSPSFFGGNLFPNEEEGEFNCVLVSDELGHLVWLPAQEVKLISVNGSSPSEILQ